MSLDLNHSTLIVVGASTVENNFVMSVCAIVTLHSLFKKCNIWFIDVIKIYYEVINESNTG